MLVGHKHAVSSFNPLVQILGEVAAEEATPWKSILMLCPLWSIWTDMRSYLNVVCLLAPSALAYTNYPLSTVGYRMTPYSGFTSSSPPPSSSAIHRKVQVMDSIRTKMDACLFFHKVTKVFKGRPDFCWLPKVSVSFSSYGTHGISQSSGLRTSFRLSSLPVPLSSSFACSMSIFFSPR